MTEGRELIMNDGTVYSDSECGYADHQLWCYVKNSNLTDVFAVFSDSSKTEKIIFRYGSTEEIYTGFTALNLIKVSEYTIDIRLSGNNTSIDVHEINLKDGDENG